MKNKSTTLIYAIHPILELLHAKKRKIYQLFIDKGRQKDIDSILKKLPKYTQINYYDKKKLDLLCQSADHQGIVAEVSLFIYQKNFFNPHDFPILLFCDSIQDTKNLGALLRSAYCTNILGVVISEESSADITASTFKSSAGLAEHLCIFKTKNMKSTLNLAKNNGYSIYLAAGNGIPLDQININFPCAIVIGNEHNGIRQTLYELGTQISLRQKTTAISYNASVAGGILLYSIATLKKLI